MATTITTKVTIETGNKIQKFGNGWRLYTDKPLYGKEPKISDKNIEQLLNSGLIKKVKDERNLAMVTTGFHYEVL